MDKIVTFGLGIIMLGILVVSGLSLSEEDAAGQAARRYKEDCIAEIENSNFNDAVIDSCIDQAAENGYTMTVNKIVVDDVTNQQIAEVSLKYSYEIPILKLSEEKVVKGVAR